MYIDLRRVNTRHQEYRMELRPSASLMRTPDPLGTKINSAEGSTNFLINHGQAIRSILGRSRVIHFISVYNYFAKSSFNPRLSFKAL